jgi:CxxC-x17-CxxC domain-containing protein
MRFFPKTKEEVLKLGYLWDDFEKPSAICTIKSEALPQTINETGDSILKEVIECVKCKHGYRILEGELDLLRKTKLPIPHECPKCRENRRFERMNGPGMYHRNCAKCSKNIYTPYAPERPEIVYCVDCYQQEFI